MNTYQIQQLADLCREHPVASKTVFVPSGQAGSALGVALARAGTDWVNLRFCTPEELAKEIAEPRYLADGWLPLPKEADLIELAPIVRAFLRSPGNLYFSDKSYSQGLLRSIHRTLRALRIAGTPAEDLLRQKNNPKLRSIARLYVAYQDCLEDRKWYDGPDLFATALDAVRERPPGPAIWAILDETPLPGLAKRFIRALTDDKVLRIGRSRYGVLLPDTVAASGLAESPLVAEHPCEPAGECLGSGSRGSTLRGLELRRTAGPEIEVRGALSRILRERWPLDSVEIVCAAPDGIDYVHNAVRKLAIPATFGTGVSILLTRPGQAVRTALKWVESGGLPHWLEALQGGRLLNRAAGSPGSPGSAGSAGSARSSGSHAKLPPTLREMGTLCNSDRSISFSRIALLGAQLLSEHVTTLTETEEPARDSLVRRFEELAAQVHAEGAPKDMAAALLNVIDNHRFEARAPRPGHLNVVPLDRAGFAGRPRTFILGLDSATFPGAPGEDPLLLDHERSRISGELEMLRTRPVTQTWHMIRVLGLAPHAILSAPVFRPADGQEGEPASLFHHLEDRAGGATDVETILLPPDAIPPDPPVHRLAWARRRGDPDLLRPLSPWLFSGEQAERARSQNPFTRYRGVVQKPGAAIDPEKTVWSASRLETLTACPYRYLWRYVLDIEPLEDETPDPSRWLSPLDFGALLHRLYQRFLSGHADRDTPPNVETDAEPLLDMLQLLVDEAAEEIPPPNPRAYEMDVSRLRTAALVFLAEESRRPTEQKPRGFEVSFGFDVSSGLNHPEPVVVDLGGVKLRLRGLIDRIDQTPSGYIVWDYKTGSASPYDESDLLGGGRHLQWALYAHAFGEMLASRGTIGTIRSGYYFASDREHGRKMLSVPPARHELGDLLRPLLELASRSAYPPLQKTDACRFCDYRGICAEEHTLPKDLPLDPEKDPQLGDLATQWLSS